MFHPVTISGISLSGRSRFVLIAGPCVIESEQSALYHARALKKMTRKVGVPFIFKSSFDKANRTSVSSFRGPGLEVGLAILEKVKKDIKVPVLSDVHEAGQVKHAAQVLDVLQIPAFLCRQTDLVLTAARTKKPINIKKGQFLAPWDMRQVIKKIESVGNRRILLTERGTSFGYNNLVTDFRSFAVMRKFGYPVVFDVTHSVQLPGGKGTRSGGQREFVDGLVRAALAFGCDGLFIETHKNPDAALSDSANSVPIVSLEKMLKVAKYIDSFIIRKRLRS